MANSKLPKWGAPKKKKQQGHQWPGPEETISPEVAYIVGAMVAAINVDTRNRGQVEVILGARASEVLDQSGNQPIHWYRMVLPTTNPVVQRFFREKMITQTGEYRNPNFHADVVVDGELIGYDPNPDDVSRKVQVIEGNLLFLDEAMSVTMEKPTAGMARCTLKVELPSQLAEGHIHRVGSDAVVISTTTDDDTFLIEVQADGFQECLEVPRASIEIEMDDSQEGEPN